MSAKRGAASNTLCSSCLFCPSYLLSVNSVCPHTTPVLPLSGRRTNHIFLIFGCDLGADAFVSRFLEDVPPTKEDAITIHNIQNDHYNRDIIIISMASKQEEEQDNKKQKTMEKITEGVEFDTIAREWRCKWSPDDDKKSLQEAQKALDGILADVKKVDGVKGVSRVVCGGCMDFKVVVSLSAAKFGDWEKAKFAPEESFLEKLKGIAGICEIETQTYTLMPM